MRNTNSTPSYLEALIELGRHLNAIEKLVIEQKWMNTQIHYEISHSRLIHTRLLVTGRRINNLLGYLRNLSLKDLNPHPSDYSLFSSDYPEPKTSPDGESGEAQEEEGRKA